MKKVWEMVKKITGKNQHTGMKHLNVNNVDITKNVDIANTLAESISKHSSSDNYTNKFKQIKNRVEKKPLNFKTNNNESYNSLFTIKELKESLNRAHDTASGPDDIHYQILKHMPEDSLKTLLNIYNNIWVSGDFPECWREATIIPIAKPGKDPTNPSNYRPIALTSCVCKTFERMINNRLVYFLEYNNIITPFQSGFRKNRSTIDQIIRLETVVREAFVKREHAVAVFFDLEKAYDTTWKYGIMKDLHQAGLRGRMPYFISNFLSDRKFAVRVGTRLSDLYSQEEGVPQGSILSVTLFSLKINSIVKCVTPSVECSLYVDDFLICFQSKQMHTIERQLQHSLNNIYNWSEQNGFRFSKTKTVCMHFCNLRKMHPDPTLTLNGLQIPVVQEYTFLGVIFDNKLNFISHIKYIKNKCLKALNLLKVVSHMNWGADRNVLLQLYRALIRSKLDYASIVYGSARQSYIKMLDTIHNQGLRLCLRAFRTSPMESLYVEANEPSLYRRRTKLALQYCIKLKSLCMHPVHNNIFKPKYTQLFMSKPNSIPSFGIRMQSIFSQMNITLENIAQIRLTDIPPWEFVTPNINYDLRIGKKADTNPFDFLGKFHGIQLQYPDHQFIYTDGSKDGHRVGSATVTKGKTYKQRIPNESSVFTAELKALIQALQYIQKSKHNSFIICTDSLSSLQAIENLNINHPIILDIIKFHHHLTSRNKAIIFYWVPSHVGIPGNERADRAAKSALDLNVTPSKIPSSDYKQSTRSFIWAEWQLYWNEQVNNKLQKVKPDLGAWPPLENISRRDELVITRARIGHTYLTQGYLLRNEEPPMCVSCMEALSVDHILIHCTELRDTRNKHYKCQSLQELFTKIHFKNVISFLKEAGLHWYF